MPSVMFQTSLGRDGKSFYRDKVWSRDNITITINYNTGRFNRTYVLNSYISAFN